MNDMQLDILERFLVLAHSPKKSYNLLGDVQVNYGLVGAMIIQMVEDDIITLKGKKLVVVSKEPIENPFFRELRDLMLKKKKHKSIVFWLKVMVARSSYKLRKHLRRSLTDKEIYRHERRKFLWIFPYDKYYLKNIELRNNLIFTLKEELKGDSKSIGDESLALLGLLKACTAMRILTHDRAERKLLRQRIEDVIAGLPKDTTIYKTVKEVKRGVNSSISMAVIAATSAANASFYGSHY